MKHRIILCFMYVVFTGCFTTCNDNYAHDILSNALMPSGEHCIFDADGQALEVIVSYDENCMPEYRAYPFGNITISGSYKLATRVTSQVSILTNNVTFDLNGNTISGGITIAAGLSNITIKNGTIDATSNADGILINSGCNTINILDVTVQNATRGITISNATETVLERCTLTSNVTGVFLDASSNITIKQCSALRNTHAGFSLNLSTTCALLECTALSTGEGNTNVIDNNVYGFVSQNGFCNVFDRCVANATQALSTTDYNSIISGFALTGMEQLSRITNSQSQNAMTSASGVTVPYGMYLQGTLSSSLTLTAVPPVPVPATNVNAVQWSPDQRFIAVGAAGDSLLSVYAFDALHEVVYQIASPNIIPEDAVNTVDWSPDGQYLAAGMNQTEDPGADAARIRIYSFDTINNSLTQVAIANPRPETDVDVQSLRWSPNGRYLAVGTTLTNQLRIYEFNRVSQTLQLIIALNSGETASSVDWSADGRYLAVGFISGSDTLQVYSFVPGSVSLTAVAHSASSNLTHSVRWSFDGQFIARAGEVGAIDTVDIWQFSQATSSSNASLTLQRAASLDLGVGISVDWSGDGRFIVVGYDQSPFLSVLSYDRGTNQLTHQVDPNIAPNISGTPEVRSVDWSPDGRYIVASTFATDPDPIRIYVYGALSFSSNNVIKNNVVSCNSGAQFPSGVGISGSSIANLIIQNSAYENPRNPSIAFSNYNFVCNVFNQLFGLAPTYLQNTEVNNLILQPENVDTTVKIIESKLSIIQQQVTSLLIFA